MPSEKRYFSARSTPDKKDMAMLYVFNTANGVQIAWNSALPDRKANQERRTGSLNRLIRTLSAG